MKNNQFIQTICWKTISHVMPATHTFCLDASSQHLMNLYWRDYCSELFVA